MGCGASAEHSSPVRDEPQKSKAKYRPQRNDAALASAGVGSANQSCTRRLEEASRERQSPESPSSGPKFSLKLPTSLSADPILHNRRHQGPAVDDGVKPIGDPMDGGIMESVSENGRLDNEGEVCTESPGKIALLQKMATLRALIEHGITGEVDQFPAGPVPPLRADENRRIVHWIEHSTVMSVADALGRSTSLASSSSTDRRNRSTSALAQLETSFLNWSITPSETAKPAPKTTAVAAGGEDSEEEAARRRGEEVDSFATALTRAVSAEVARREDTPLGVRGVGSSPIGLLGCSSNADASGSRLQVTTDNSDVVQHPQADSPQTTTPDLSLSDSKSPKSASLSPRHRNPVLSPALLTVWNQTARDVDSDFEISCVVVNNFPLRVVKERVHRRLDDPVKYSDHFKEIIDAIQLSASALQ